MDVFELERRDELAQKGIFEDIIYSSTITVAKGGCFNDGLFNNLDSRSIEEYSNNDSSWLILNGISLVIPIDITLSEDERLTAVVIVDGGMDISSAIIENPNPNNLNHLNTINYNSNIANILIYPNPTSSFVNFEFNSITENTTFIITCFDVLGKKITELYNGDLNAGDNKISNISVQGLPKGYNIIQIRIGNTFTNKVLLIE